LVTKLFIRLLKSKRRNIRNRKQKTKFEFVGAHAEALNLGT